MSDIVIDQICKFIGIEGIVTFLGGDFLLIDRSYNEICTA